MMADTKGREDIVSLLQSMNWNVDLLAGYKADAKHMES